MNKNTILKKLINESVNDILSEINLHTVDDAYNKASYNYSDYYTFERFLSTCEETLDAFDRLYGNEPSSEGYKLCKELENLASRISDFGRRKSEQTDNLDKMRNTRYEKEFGKDFNGMRQEIDDVYEKYGDEDDVDTEEWANRHMNPKQRQFNKNHYE